MTTPHNPTSGSTHTRPANRLALETSPYLLQHAYNPVDWYPWGPEALDRAKAEDRPILLSIGYSSCHWCHVMERESFEDEAIAALMNRHFVCIKVDREERPDLDEIYMQATVAMNQGHGGWPMTVFLTPEQQPIYAGTYFPPTDRYGRPGFRTVLLKVAEIWEKDRASLREQAGKMTERLQREVHISAPVAVGDAEIDRAVAQYREEFDSRYGGFGQAPKFPPATGLSLLLRVAHRRSDAALMQMVTKTLDAMAAGGIYDHVGGGFARYSTDAKWLVPHFEKMLYDNALLAKVYTEAYQATGQADYRRVVRETLDYILREMTGPEGGFYSATDADSEGVEGKFFVWRPEEICAAVGNEDDARRFCAYYDITPGGNFEHANIPNTPEPLAAVAAHLKISEHELQASLDRAKALLYAARLKRVPPGLDDKVIVAWNGLMISALAEAGRVLDEPRYVAAAARAADFLWSTMRRTDSGTSAADDAGGARLWRTYRVGRPQHTAVLEDYACLAEGLIDLYEASADERYLHAASSLAERIVTDFRDEQRGGFFTTGRGHEALIVRAREGPDGATPSANAVAASVLARLSYHFDRTAWRDAAATALRIYGRAMSRYPRAFAKSLLVADFLLEGPTEVAIVGRRGSADRSALEAALRAEFLPNRLLAFHEPDAAPTRLPLLTNRTMVNGQAALYVCRNYTCRAPITTPSEVAAAVRATPNAAAGTTDTQAASSASRSLSGTAIVGAATAGGTAGYAVRQLANASPTAPNGQAYTQFGSTGWTTSRLGFGCYRIDTNEADHHAALTQALRDGCNLIDTSTNYADGDSERLVGLVLSEMIRRHELTRQEVILVSKIGYVQGQNHTQAQAREQAGRPYSEMVKYGEGLWHCMHPDFLADQLKDSLDRLGVATLDVCLLHNPEYVLLDAKQRGGRTVDETRAEFYDKRLFAAFTYLETQVTQGRLGAYGVSSNTLTAGADDPAAVSLSRVWDVAERAAQSLGRASSAFRVVQCPMNLFESGAVLVRNTGPTGQDTVLSYAQTRGLAVLVNRPLNAIPPREGQKGGIIRLADPEPVSAPVAFDAQRQVVAQLEAEYRTTIAPQVPHAGQGLPPNEYFPWAEELAKVRGQIDGLEHWDHVETQMISPHLSQVIRALGNVLQGEQAERWEAWRERYVPELLRLLQCVRSEATTKSRERMGLVRNAFADRLPAERRHEPLSRLALWVLASTPGVTAVLNGMRTPAYVNDSMSILRWDLLPQPLWVYDSIQMCRLP
ncbi:MAG: aldo/keto reductase [Nitrospiraceae bacterium]